MMPKAPECPNVKKLKNGGLDQYGPERFGRLIFATIRKKCGHERVNTATATKRNYKLPPLSSPSPSPFPLSLSPFRPPALPLNRRVRGVTAGMF